MFTTKVLRSKTLAALLELSQSESSTKIAAFCDLSEQHSESIHNLANLKVLHPEVNTNSLLLPYIQTWNSAYRDDEIRTNIWRSQKCAIILKMSVEDLQLVTTFRPLLELQIERLVHVKNGVDSHEPVSETDCAQLLQVVKDVRNQTNATASSQSQYAAIETVLREKFIDLVATVSIFDPSFGRVWILLDTITVLSDHELCEPGLVFWLVEELLDSQTIDGCRKVFDYLESRRERITAKHFKHKSLVILRCCNELLRRLSRAEDTVFCGRVFIFLFQSFPLGDKSSVNLRGEFHVENVTTFDPTLQKSEDAIKPMEIDTEGTQQLSSGALTPASAIQDGDQPKTSKGTSTKTSKTESKDEPPPDLNSLYPKFWTLQSFFSSPTRLFDSASMATFKEGIGATILCFKRMSNNATTTSIGTDTKRGTKRRRIDLESGNSATTFNPKYLTNRDLFDLEIHDIAFRRHILVQALIMVDFLLSLTASAKAKYEGLTNKSVLYAYTLSEEDTKWAQSTRSSIASYLQQGNGNEGKFYYRMVDTVLSRDKNWVRWKAENCPTISRDPIDLAVHIEAQKTLTKLCEKSTMPAPPGANDLSFLSKSEPIEALKKPSERHQVPTMEDYWKGIQGDDLDMDFAMTDEEKKELEERKAGRIWRALRSSGRRFVLCEKIQNGNNLKALVGTTEEEEEDTKGAPDADGSGEVGEDDDEEQKDDKAEEAKGDDIHAKADDIHDPIGSDEQVNKDQVTHDQEDAEMKDEPTEPLTADANPTGEQGPELEEDEGEIDVEAGETNG